MTDIRKSLTDREFEQYYDLRYRLLRAPLNDMFFMI